MKSFALLVVVLGVAAAVDSKPAKRAKAGTGWRGKVSKWLPGALGRRLAYTTATGYDTDKCLTASESCPGPKASVCTAHGDPAATPLCTDPDLEVTTLPMQAQLYQWAAKTATEGAAAHTIIDVPAGADWNKWTGATGCGDAGCTDVYKKAILVYDADNCWPASKAVPILVNSRDATHPEQLKLCAKSVHHLLGKKPLGAFLRSPVEQLERIIAKKVLIVCGNTAMKANDAGEKVKDTTKANYPMLEGEGGGGTFGAPFTFAEHTGMCGAWNKDLGPGWKTGQTRFGGTVTTEEYGHTFFDIAIAQNDPQGWIAVQKAEAAAYAAWVADNKKGHQRDPDWDCHTAATEYYAAGVELLLYNVRIGENHKATTRAELKTMDPMLWCLSLRHYELDNQFSPCSEGPSMTALTVQDVDCKKLLGTAGVTVFGPEGSEGAKGGGTKTKNTDMVSSTAKCQTVSSTSSECAAYSAAGPVDPCDANALVSAKTKCGVVDGAKTDQVKVCSAACTTVQKVCGKSKMDLTADLAKCAKQSCDMPQQILAYTACGIPTSAGSNFTGVPEKTKVCSSDCKAKSDNCTAAGIASYITQANCTSSGSGSGAVEPEPEPEPGSGTKFTGSISMSATGLTEVQMTTAAKAAVAAHFAVDASTVKVTVTKSRRLGAEPRNLAADTWTVAYEFTAPADKVADVEAKVTALETTAGKDALKSVVATQLTNVGAPKSAVDTIAVKTATGKKTPATSSTSTKGTDGGTTSASIRIKVASVLVTSSMAFML